MFETICQTKLTNKDLRVIVKAQDYQIKNNDEYIGGLHKDGLFEKIQAIGIYYYQIDNGLSGGDLQLSGVYKCIDTDYQTGGTMIRDCNVKVSEGMGIVFNNERLYHKVKSLKKTSNDDTNTTLHRKIISFFLMDITKYISSNCIDTRYITVNWKYHTIYLLKHWILKCFTDNNQALLGHKYLYNIIIEYVCGTTKYIDQMKQKYYQCRRQYSYHMHYYTKTEITTTPTMLFSRVHACNLD